jgi:hypothetical protein
MANKFDGDVRPLSNDPRYMGVVFQGSIDDAIAQAKAAPDHGLPEQDRDPTVSRDRWNLLEHLNLTKNWRFKIVTQRVEEMDIMRDNLDFEVEAVRDAQPRYEDRNFIVPANSDRVISKYSLEYAIARGWVVPVQS